MSADSVTAAEVRLDNPWRRAWLASLAIWGTAVVAYGLVNVAFWTATTTPAPALRDILDVWYRWDTIIYLDVSSHGYDPGSPYTAFFPLYSGLIWLVNPVLPGGALPAGLFVSSVATVVALAFLYRLTEELVDRETAGRAPLYLMASPVGFYLVAAYNESLFIALVTASLYLMRRGQWTAAALVAGAASGSRYFGVVLAIAFAVEYLRQRDWDWRRIRWNASAILLVPWGLVAFMVYSARAFGDAWNFSHLQQEYWGHRLSAPWVGPSKAVEFLQLRWAVSPVDPYAVLSLLDLASVVALIALLVLSLVGPWKLGQHAWYLIAIGVVSFLGVLLTPMFSILPPMHGMPRYALEVTAIFIVLARLGANRAFDRIYLVLGAALQTTLLLAFFSGYLVT